MVEEAVMEAGKVEAALRKRPRATRVSSVFQFTF
jgi:hypothetical protein